MKFKESIYDFIEKICDVEGLLEVVLFGSVARGEAKRGSDIDFFVVVEREEAKEEVRKVKEETDENFELTFSDRNFSKYGESFVSEVYGEGIILYSKRPKLQMEELGKLEPRTLISFSLTNLSQSDKMKIKRALYGSKSRTTYKGKEYQSEVQGLVPEEGRVGRGAILVSKKTERKVEEVFSQYEVVFRKIGVWV